MSAHTPGPWMLKQDDVLMYQTLIIPGNRQAPIGVVYGNINDIENGANARLISAAPEMLWALEACSEAMAYMSEYDIPLCLPDKVKAAIAKAKGEV